MGAYPEMYTTSNFHHNALGILFSRATLPRRAHPTNFCSYPSIPIPKHNRVINTIRLSVAIRGIEDHLAFKRSAKIFFLNS